MSLSRRVLIGALVVALAVLGWSIQRRPAAPPRGGPTTGLNVVLVAIDSLDPVLLSRYAESRGLIELEKLLDSGYAGTTTAAPPYLPDACWMQLASGRPLSDPEIARVTDDPSGRIFGVLPRIAETASEQGATCVSVGWPGSWPVGATEAIVVAPYAPPAVGHPKALPPAILAEVPDAVSDPELADFVDTIARASESRVHDLFDELILDNDPEGSWREQATALRWALLADLVSLEIGARLLAEHQPDLTLIYLGGLDTASHRFLGPSEPETFAGIPDAIVDRYGDVIGNYYAFIDDALERIYRLREDDTILIVCSCYGITPTVGGPGGTGAHDAGPQGFINIRGPGIARPPSAAEVSVHDVTPTILAALGLTIPNDVAGRVLVEALPQGLAAEVPPRYVNAPEREEPPPPPEETALIERIAAERLADLRGR